MRHIPAFLIPVLVSLGAGLLSGCSDMRTSDAAMPAYSMAYPVTSQTFAEKVAMGNKFEIASSEMAVRKAEDPRVRSFARHMIKDHSQAGRDFTAALMETNLTEPNGLPDARHAAILAELKAAQGRNFDRKYIQAQADAHDETVALFREYAAKDGSPALTRFARNTLPTLEEHQRMAHDLEDAVLPNPLISMNDR
jgi:putative membrane protein